jgi:hypothetical protein
MSRQTEGGKEGGGGQCHCPQMSHWGEGKSKIGQKMSRII